MTNKIPFSCWSVLSNAASNLTSLQPPPSNTVIDPSTFCVYLFLLHSCPFPSNRFMTPLRHHNHTRMDPWPTLSPLCLTCLPGEKHLPRSRPATWKYWYPNTEIQNHSVKLAFVNTQQSFLVTPLYPLFTLLGHSSVALLPSSNSPTMPFSSDFQLVPWERLFPRENANRRGLSHVSIPYLCPYNVPL